MAAENLIGRRFNRLLVIGRAENNKSGQSRWICKCDCGGECIAPRQYLISKQIGCKKCTQVGCPTHKLSHLNEYAIWTSMKQRCTNTNHISYHNYGGRGISFCKRWEKFENFYADMGPRPSSNHTLERIDNDKNYERSNCKWATRKEQARNFRRNRILEFNGRKKCVSEWAEELGITHDTIHRRLKRGYTIEQALTNKYKPNKILITVNGVKMSITAAEKLLGFGSGTILWRLKHGYTEEEAVSPILGGKNPYKTIKNKLKSFEKQ